jgi:peptide/nickel transport system substrate-binding protein
MIITLRADVAPFTDINVRRAASLAVDKESILRDYYKRNADLVTWPLQPDASTTFTPFEQLPAELKELYTYNIEKAKKLLADAGYSKGFKTDMLVNPIYKDIAAIIKDQWFKAGIDVELKIPDAAIFWTTVSARTYATGLFPYGNTNPYNFFTRYYKSGHSLNWSFATPWSGESHIEATREIIMNNPNPDERDKLIKELNLYTMGLIYVINLPLPNNYVAWQPWLKGYQGEASLGNVWSTESFYHYVWIDQDLKFSITGKR